MKPVAQLLDPPAGRAHLLQAIRRLAADYAQAPTTMQADPESLLNELVRPYVSADDLGPDDEEERPAPEEPKKDPPKVTRWELIDE